MQKFVSGLKRAVLQGQQQVFKKSDASSCNAYSDSVGPLHAAASCHNREAARQLLELGFNPNVVSPQGSTPLHTAARCNAEEVTDLLIRAGAHLGAVDAASCTPLMVAAGLGHSGIVKLLLSGDDVTSANADHRDTLGNSALHLAAEGDHVEVVNLLVAWSANVWALNDRGETPIEVAKRNGCQRVGEYLGPIVAARECQDKRDLQLSQTRSSNLVLSVLQDLRSDVQAAGLEAPTRQTPDGKTLLHWAAVRDSADCAEYLLGCDIQVDAVDGVGNSALHFAALNNADRVCALLLAAGADPNLQETGGLTPLMMCMIAGSDAVARRLVLTGRLRLDTTDGEGETALMHAARRGDEALVKLVVDGSNILMKNRCGLSALQISEMHGNQPSKVSELLEARGGRPSVDAYPRRSPKAGYCLVINQMYKSPGFPAGTEELHLAMREGSDKDVTRIYDVFKARLGFEVHTKHDLTSDAIMQQMQKLRDQMSPVDFFVCFILAHGLGDAVLGTDARLVQIKDIAQQVDIEHCPALAGKPKIFFIQACRNRVDTVVPEWQQPSELPRARSDKPPDLSKHIDFFFGFSTWEDCVSYRCRWGSLYIQELCNIIEESHASMDLLKMMTRVCRKVGSTPIPGKDSTCYMVPNIKSCLQKDVKF